MHRLFCSFGATILLGPASFAVAQSNLPELPAANPGRPVLFFFFRQIIDANHEPEALLRDCRFLASIEMHTEGKSVDDATQLFIRECHTPQAEARREAYRGTGDPGYLNYTVGKLEILKLRDDYKKAMGAKFSLTEFHDRFLAAGSVPVKIIRREMLGADGPLL